MHWLPYQEFILESPLDKATCLANITANTEKKAPFFSLRMGVRSGKAYQSLIQGEQFEIERTYPLQDRFFKRVEPMVKTTGTFQPQALQNSRIHIHMQPNTTMIFCSLLVIFLISGAMLVEAQKAIASPSSLLLNILIYLCASIFLYTLELFLFHRQAEDLKQFLLDLLQARECSF